MKQIWLVAPKEGASEVLEFDEEEQAQSVARVAAKWAQRTMVVRMVEDSRWGDLPPNYFDPGKSSDEQR